MNPAAFLAAMLVLTAASLGPARAQTQAFSADIGEIRRAANIIPGAKPLRLNIVKFAESRRTKNFSVKGAARDPSIQARTAFQLVYPDGTVMIDSGMELQVHKFFGRGTEEPYFPEREAEIEKALGTAKAIVVTHEHGDHVAGVIRSPDFAALAGKTVLTRAQVQTLMTAPQMPEIKLNAEQARRFNVIDYDKYYPFAPGMVLIKSAGHTPGSQMVYVMLATGKEYVLAGDVSWHMDGVREIKVKDAPWITEDEPAITAELTWLNMLTRNELNVSVVLSHDEEQRLELIAQRILGDGLE